MRLRIIANCKSQIANLKFASLLRYRSPPHMSAPPGSHRHEVQAGLAYALAAYLWWGFMPLYFKLVMHVPPVMVLAHRVVWSFLLLSALVTGLSRWNELRAIVRQRRTLALLAASTILLAANWGTFIYAVETNQVLQA